MICLILGLQGSGKTACCVREMLHDKSGKMYFSNIKTKHLHNNIMIKPEMIVSKDPILNNKGSQAIKNGMPMYKYSVNVDFWKEQNKKYNGLNVIIDEAHIILNARKSMSKHTQPILDWISLLRRVLGSSQSEYGKLYLITQIERRLDVVAKEQATEVRFYLCHYERTCPKCRYNISETNEIPDPMYSCLKCNSITKKHSHIIEVWHFKNYMDFIAWKYLNKGKTYYNHYIINDIEDVFPLYNTMQWENLISDF